MNALDNAMSAAFDANAQSNSILAQIELMYAAKGKINNHGRLATSLIDMAHSLEVAADQLSQLIGNGDSPLIKEMRGKK